MAQPQPQQPRPGQVQQRPPQMIRPGMPMPAPMMQAPPPPDPAMQALIEADFRPVDIAISDEKDFLLCGAHKLAKCPDCGVDYNLLNRINKLFILNPTLKVPPPPNMLSQNITTGVNKVKEEGNLQFKMKKYEQALARYTQAAGIASARPPWESNGLMREELSTVLSNRSAAFFEAGDFIGSLTDAEGVISLRRPWSKGHFRKAKALVGMGKYDDAKDAIRLGLAFEPNNVELLGFLRDIETAQERIRTAAAEAAAKAEAEAKAASQVASTSKS